MLKILIFIVTGAFLTQPVRGYDVVPTDAMCAEMLTEIKACFSGTHTVEQFTNEWKWGSVRLAYVFKFGHVAPEKREECMVLATSPVPLNTNKYYSDLLTPLPPTRSDLKKCHWAFGVKKSRASGKQSLTFIFCPKRSAMYPLMMKHFGLQEPQYEDICSKQPSQCWATIVYSKIQFEYSWVDDQFVREDSLHAEMDVIYLFNQQECEGVMLLGKNNVPSKDESRKVSSHTGILDFSKFTEKFRWVPDHQIEHFANEKENLNPRVKERLTNLLDSQIILYKGNEEYIRHSGFRFLGEQKTPAIHFVAPWRELSYYESLHGDTVLRSIVGIPQWLENFDSFVLNVSNLSGEAQILLPYGLDIRPYLHTPPSSRLLYEHVRADKRVRIVVQPHIAYLYEDNRLSKILVCNDENGPPDHGWSLVREFYVCEETGYFWPVTRAYSPLE